MALLGIGSLLNCTYWLPIARGNRIFYNIVILVFWCFNWYETIFGNGDGHPDKNLNNKFLYCKAIEKL
jgi:hypothetical protein